MPPETSAEAIPVGADGFCHPTNEAQLIALVKQVPKGGQLRVRGAAHSVATRSTPIRCRPSRTSRTGRHRRPVRTQTWT